MTGKTTDGRTRVGIGKKLADRLEILLSLLTIPCGLGFFHSLESGDPSARFRILLPAAFLFLSLITLLRAATNRDRPSAPFRRQMDLLFAGAFFLCAVLGLAVQNSLIPWLVADSVILVWLIAGRAVAIAREPRSWKGILNAALLLLFGALLLFLWSKETKADEAL